MGRALKLWLDAKPVDIQGHTLWSVLVKSDEEKKVPRDELESALRRLDLALNPVKP